MLNEKALFSIDFGWIFVFRYQSLSVTISTIRVDTHHAVWHRVWHRVIVRMMLIVHAKANHEHTCTQHARTHARI